MKIVFLINSIKNPGGMERVLINKANYFSEKYNYDITIITTDQNEAFSFYPLNPNVKCIDLNINYFEDFKKSFYKRVFSFVKKQKEHREKLEKTLLTIKSDFVISLGCEDTYFLPSISDNSLKIREFHFGKNYRKQHINSFKKNFLYKIKAYIDTFREEKLVDKYDKVILLTLEDLENWKSNEKFQVIYNSIQNIPKISSNCKNKKIISVGRLDGQKGYDRLIEVWKIIKTTLKDEEWTLEIYGHGVDKEKILEKIKKYKLQKSFILKGLSNRIEEKYIESSIYVMSSRYEGFGMVLIEALAAGLPVVAFNCLSGPRDIITNGEDGYLVEDGNLNEMAQRILELISDENKRALFGRNGRKNMQKYLESEIMDEWKNLFDKLKKEKKSV